MRGNVTAVVVALLCASSLVLAAPLLQPDLASVADSSAGEQGNEPLDDAIAEASKNEPDSAGAGSGSGGEPGGGASDEPENGAEGDPGGESGSGSEREPGGESGVPPTEEPFAGEKYDDADRERLADDSDPIDEQANGGTAGEVGELQYGAVQTFYWRDSSYDRYTGDGWEQTGGANTYAPPHDFDGPAERQRFEITAETPMSIVPAPYQPVAVEAGGADVVVRDGGAFELTDRVASGTSMTVTSDVPEWSYSELKQASADYDPAILERYGTPRSKTPARVTERTDRITADQSTPYGTAVAIEHWLKTEREYSLEVPPPNGDVVDQFIHEMDAGYCEYFASAMTEMLRTQGVPARYVSGYSRAPIDENGVEEVTADQAHAWVEVYFEGVGWVTFDPTPPERDEARLDNTERTATSDPFEPEPNYAQHDGDDDWEVVDADVELLTDPIPGTDGTVRVTDAGSPLTDHRVSYNGDVVGSTDENGEVTGTLPYASSLTVTVERYMAPGEPDEEELADETNESDEEELADETDEVDPPEEGDDGDESDADDSQSGDDEKDDTNRIGSEDPPDERSVGGSIESLPEDTVFSVQHDPADAQPALISDTALAARAFASGASLGALDFSPPVADSDGIPLDTDIDIALDDDEPLHPGSTVTLTATIRGNPVPDATVTVGNETYTTDENGTVDIDVPYVDSTSVEATRDSATGMRDVAVATDVSVAFTDDVVPGSAAPLEATIDGRPVTGLQVLVNDAVITRTDANGTATLPISYAKSVRVVTSRGAVSGATTAELPTKIAVDTGWLVLPGGSATLTATVDGVPVSNATVTAPSTADTETDRNGTAVLSVPLTPRPALAYTVERGAATGGGSIDLLRSWLVTALVALGLTGVVVRRLNLRSCGRQAVGSTARLGEFLAALPRRIVTRIVRLAVWGKDAFARGGRGTLTTLRSLVSGLIGVARCSISAVLQLFTALATAITATSHRVSGWLGWLFVGPRTWLTRLRSIGGGADDAGGASDDDGAGTAELAVSASGDEDSAEPRVPPRVIVLRAWRWLLGVVKPASTMTPAEIADRATALGLPDRYVRRILDAFRSLRYGHRSPSPEDAESVADAEQSLRSATEGDE